MKRENEKIPEVGDLYKTAEQCLCRKGQCNPVRTVIGIKQDRYGNCIVQGKFENGMRERKYLVDIVIIDQNGE